jgi:hypothetical protein
MGAAFEILDVDVDPQNWTAIVAPFSCNNVAIRNTLSVDLRIRTDLSKPGEDLISPNVQEGVVAPISGAPFWRDAKVNPYRFMEGSTVAYLRSTSGSGTVKVRFVR